MKLIDLDNDEMNSFLKITDFDNFFDVFVDKRENIVFDVNKTLYINADPASLPEYTCTTPMHWPLISYKLYSTTRLAWLLWKLNHVNLDTIFDIKQPGDKIKYLPKEYVDNIVAQINEFE